MKTINDEQKKFDAIKVMRKIRDEISLEIIDMSYIEEKEYITGLLTKNRANKPTSDKSELPEE